MIYTGDLLKINGNVIPQIQSYKIGRSKLWKDSDRNMAGSVRATFLGIYPKITIKVGYLTQEEMSNLTKLLDQDFFEVEWFDVRVQATTTAKYYASDYDTELYSKIRGLYQPFEVSLVPCEKRKY